MEYKQEQVSMWLANMLSQEASEVKGSMRNEHIFALGAPAHEVGMHSENMMMEQAYLSVIQHLLDHADVIAGAVLDRANARTQFMLTVGDFSQDGHGRYEEYPASAAKPLDEVRDAQFRIKDVTGIDLFGLFQEPDNDLVPDDFCQKLEKLGYQFSHELYQDDAGTHFLSKDLLCDMPDELARIWVHLLNCVDPTLEVRLEEEPQRPELLFTGLDEKGRKCSPIGYGLFHQS